MITDLFRPLISPDHWHLLTTNYNLSLLPTDLPPPLIYSDDWPPLTTELGTPTKRPVSKRQVSKRPVSKRPVSKRLKRQVYKTSALQNVRFTKRRSSKRQVAKPPVSKVRTSKYFKTSFFIEIHWPNLWTFYTCVSGTYIHRFCVAVMVA